MLNIFDDIKAAVYDSVDDTVCEICNGILPTVIDSVYGEVQKSLLRTCLLFLLEVTPKRTWTTESLLDILEIAKSDEKFDQMFISLGTRNPSSPAYSCYVLYRTYEYPIRTATIVNLQNRIRYFLDKPHD